VIKFARLFTMYIPLYFPLMLALDIYLIYSAVLYSERLSYNEYSLLSFQLRNCSSAVNEGIILEEPDEEGSLYFSNVSFFRSLGVK